MDLKQRNWSIHLIRMELYWYQKMIYVWFWAKIGVNTSEPNKEKKQRRVKKGENSHL